MTKQQAEVIAGAIINQILDRGLVGSTWKEMHERAYEDLLEYRKDLVEHAITMLVRLEVK